MSLSSCGRTATPRFRTAAGSYSPCAALQFGWGSPAATDFSESGPAVELELMEISCSNQNYVVRVHQRHRVQQERQLNNMEDYYTWFGGTFWQQSLLISHPYSNFYSNWGSPDGWSLSNSVRKGTPWSGHQAIRRPIHKDTQTFTLISNLEWT